MSIIDLKEYKKNKIIKQDLARGRTPLYVSHLTGKITGKQDVNDPDFGSRLERIRASLEKINRLMAELKEMSEDSQNVR